MISITIIFNEQDIDLPVIHLEAKIPYHSALILRINVACELDIDKNNYIEDLIKNNHVIITTTNDVCLCYIPSKITENQYSSLLELKSYLKKFNGFSGTIMEEKPLHFFKENQIDTTIDNFLEYVSKNCVSKTRK